MEIILMHQLVYKILNNIYETSEYLYHMDKYSTKVLSKLNHFDIIIGVYSTKQYQHKNVNRCTSEKNAGLCSTKQYTHKNVNRCTSEKDAH